jgi:hypothetical protein
LSRHGILHSKRSKLLALTAAGAFTVASAATAAAMTLPGDPAPSASKPAVSWPASTTPAQASLTFRLHAQEEAEAATASKAVAAAAKKAAAKKAAAKKAAAKKEAAANKAAAAKRAAAAKAKAAAAAAAAKRRTVHHSSIPSGSPQQIAEEMLGSYGWSSSQFSCLYNLWERESGWNMYAENPSSGAYGIPQSLPAGKMASAGPDWSTSAYTQIKWGLGYIRDTYGSPCGAWSHELSAGWY